MSATPTGLDRPLRSPTATNLIVAGFFAVALYDVLLGGLFSASGLLVPAQVWRGEWYRLLGAVFLHADLLHVAIDCAVLLLLGPASERVYGRSRTVLGFVFSGLVAGLTTVALRPADAAVTASGGVAGLAGLLAGLVTFRPGTLPEPIENRIKVVVAGMLVVFSFLGYLVEHANVTLHLGGFLAGLLLATAFEPELPSLRRRELAVPAAVVLLGGLAGLGFVGGQRGAEATLVAATLRADELETAGQRDDAIRELERALAEPAAGSADALVLPFAQNQLAWYYVEAGHKVERALDLSIESNNRRPDTPEFLDTLGYLYALAGRCGEAADTMGRAAGLNAAYEARRAEVGRACAAGERPDSSIEPVAPSPTPTPRAPGPIGA